MPMEEERAQYVETPIQRQFSARSEYYESDRRKDDDVAVTVREKIKDHESRIRELEEWHSELRGAMGLVKITLGASLLSAVLAIITITDLLSKAH